MKNNSTYKALKYLVVITSVVTSIAGPIILSVIMVNRFGFSGITVILGVILGIMLAAMTIYKFTRKA